MNDRVSIILPNYVPDDEVRSRLREFLVSLDENTDRQSYQFVVVENGSHTPRLVEMANIYTHKGRPIGYARAVNLGVALADEDLLVVANNDLILPPKWLPQLVADYKEHGPGILSPIHYAGSGPGIKHDSCWFSLFITDRLTWQVLRGFDETLPYRYHDQEMAVRAKQKGYIVAQTGNVVVTHYESSTYKKMNGREQWDQQERAAMVERYGAATFVEWLGRQA